MIPVQAVEALAASNYEREQGEGAWRFVPLSAKPGWLEEARAQCEVVAPHLMAEALREAATNLAQLPYVRPDAAGRVEYERTLAVRRGNTDAWLRARADSLEVSA